MMIRPRYRYLMIIMIKWSRDDMIVIKYTIGVIIYNIQYEFCCGYSQFTHLHAAHTCTPPKTKNTHTYQNVYIIGILF